MNGFKAPFITSLPRGLQLRAVGRSAPRWATLVCTVLIILVAAACGSEPQGVVQGVIVDMKAKSLTTLDTLTIRDDSGELWTFSAQGPLEFTPSHLLEHKAFQFYVNSAL